jgi:tetratricopeptide (TPR) repeat protein
MSDIFPKEKNKIIERINRYERSLRTEKRKFGLFDDGYGKRYLLGPLYLLLDDVEGAIKHYKWFKEDFDDDSGEPIHRLCWVLAYLRIGNTEEARKSLMRVMLINLYIIPKLIGIDQKKIKGWYGCNWEWKEYLEEIPQQIWKLWKSEEISWVKDLYFSESIMKLRNRYIEVNEQLEKEPVGKRRSKLVEEIRKLRDSIED